MKRRRRAPPSLAAAAALAAAAVGPDVAGAFLRPAGTRPPTMTPAASRRRGNPTRDDEATTKRPSASRLRLLRLPTDDGGDGDSLLPSSLQTIRSPSSSSSSLLEASDVDTMPLLPVQFETLTRILLPSFLSSIVAFVAFPQFSLYLSYLINDSATFAVLSVDSSQFIQNFLTVTGLTFSILLGQTYYFMYQQQEAVFVSLFGEVTEAKSLLEQVALVCQGRRDMYETCLVAVRR